MTILLFLAVLFVLILVHEWGHYIVAKKTDMQVDEFGIGFPPKLYGKKVGETEYTLNALPIGGFVRIVGENAEDIVSGEASNVNPRSFVAKSKWAQTAVLIAGVTMNVLFAWLLYLIVFIVGVPTVMDEASASPEAELVVTQVLADSPAAAAGIPVGAVITGLVHEETAVQALVPSAFQSFTQSHANRPLTVTYQQNDIEFVTTVTPVVGLFEGAPEQPVVGVSLGLIENVQYPFGAALWQATQRTYQMLGAITVGLGTLLANAVIGQADFSQVAGPVGIAGLVGDAASFGFMSLLLFTAAISLNLAIINLLPFPALDGGRLVMVGIEAVTRRPINPKWVMRLNGIGIILLLTLMVVVTYNDILRLL